MAALLQKLERLQVIYLCMLYDAILLCSYVVNLHDLIHPKPPRLLQYTSEKMHQVRLRHHGNTYVHQNTGRAATHKKKEKR